ncbi:MAG: hypothetical protein ACRC57_03685 [Sarcina sp.]
MKKLITIVIGILIILGVFIFVMSGNGLTLTNQSLLQSPKVVVQKDKPYIRNTNIEENKNINNNTNNENTNSENSTNNLNNNIVKNTNSSNVIKNNATTTQVNTMQNSNIQNNRFNEFSSLMKSSGILYGTVDDGAQIIIPCSQGKVVNGQLLVPEYYVDMPWEEFSDSISFVNGRYIIKEYYEGQETGEFNLALNGNKLTGIFTHIENGAQYNTSFTLIGKLKENELASKPFYIGVIGNTTVALTNEFNGTYTQYYDGDKHLSNVVKVNSQNSTYQIELNVYTKGVLSGQYMLNCVGSDTYTGIYITNPNTPNASRSTVGLTGSFSPFSV